MSDIRWAIAGIATGITGMAWSVREWLINRDLNTRISVIHEDAKDKKCQKAINEKVNFELQNYVASKLAFRKFHHSWQNGTGYFDGAVTYDFKGIAKNTAIYSFCPATSRFLIIFNKAGTDGKNVVWFKRYSEYDSTLWIAQHQGDGFFKPEAVNGEVHSGAMLVALKKLLDAPSEGMH